MPNRGMRPSAQRRLRTITAAVPGLHQGLSLALRPGAAPAALSRGGPALVVVEHGDDGEAARPTADVVYWVGAAEPVNGQPYDFWYTENVD